MGEAVAEGLVQELRAHTGRTDLQLRGSPRLLPGGASAELYEFAVIDPPPGFEGPLVLRLPVETAEAERAVHAAVVHAGYPAPRLRFDGDGSAGLGRPFLVMDRVDGKTPMAAAGVLGLPRLFREMPGLLAGLMADLHAVPTAGLEGTALDITATLLAGVPAGIERDWLEASRPPSGPVVICHGDLHGLNVLVDRGEVVAVVDWELAGLGPAELDVARTQLILGTLPGVSGLGRRLLRRSAARTAAAFVGTYRARRPLDDETLRWFTVLHAARLLAVAQGRGSVADVWRPTVADLHERVRTATR
jgi:aminoglycoside phosphotransferase (APT) family kinase protein